MERGAIFLWLVVSLLGSYTVGCAPFTRVDGVNPPAAAVAEDGLVFEGSATDLPGSFGRLVLEKNFQQTQRLRWESADTRIGATQVDFFPPRDWRIEGDSPAMLSFGDRSPGPILLGTVRLEPHGRAEVWVVLGNDRVRYTLVRVEGDGSQ